MSQLIFRYRVWVVNLVAEDQEGGFGQVFHGEQGIQLGFGLVEAFVVFGVDEEDDPGDFGEVVTPKAAGCGRIGVLGSNLLMDGRRGPEVRTLLVASEVKGCESVVADGEFF